MIWLTWRQFRTQASVIFAVAIGFAAVLAITGPQLLDDYRASGVDFLAQASADTVDKSLYVVAIAVLYALPAIVGAFWGAPMVARELEGGTHRLVWNQTITRTRWLGSKLGLVGLAAVASASLLSLAVSWWSSPIDQAIEDGGSGGFLIAPRLEPLIFGARGIVPIGYTVFAFALGVTLGLLVRRSVPALAITLALVVAVQIVMPVVVRAHLLSPAQVTTTITTENLKGLMGKSSAVDDSDGRIDRLTVEINQPDAWVISNRTVDASGAIVTAFPAWTGDCIGPRRGSDPKRDACFTRLTDAGYRQLVTYQPGSRLWPLQWIETAILLALAALLSGFCFCRIKRDIT